MFYILNTCSDYALKEVLGVIRRVISVTAIVVPILLIVGGTITLIKGILNPDDRKTFKTFTNAIASAVIVFLLPFLVNITMGIIRVVLVMLELMKVEVMWHLIFLLVGQQLMLKVFHQEIVTYQLVMKQIPKKI